MNLSSRHAPTIVVLLGVLGALFGAPEAKSDPAREAQLQISIPHVPAPVRIEGQSVLVYEVHLSNVASTSLRIKRVNVRTEGQRPIRARFAEQDIRQRLALIGEPGGNDGQIPAGRQAILYLEVAAGTSPPRRVQHEIDVESGNPTVPIASTAITHVADAAVAVPPPPGFSFGPPLRGGPWVAVYSPAWPRGHRRVFYPGPEREVLPGRFAIDWVRADADGHIAQGDGDRAADHFGYGEPVLAVAAGRIASIRDGVPEPGKLSDATLHAPDQSAGNYVVLDLLNGRFAIYEHLRPGSLKVKAGDTVREGDVLGQLGFTGDSTGPHLHLHVAEAPLPTATEGVAYQFRQFTRLGHYEDVSRLGQAKWTPAKSTRALVRRRELPMSNAVVMFPNP